MVPVAHWRVKVNPEIRQPPWVRLSWYDEIRAGELRDLDADLDRVPWLPPSSHRNPARTTTEQRLDDAIEADQAAARAREPVVDEVPSWLLPDGAA